MKDGKFTPLALHTLPILYMLQFIMRDLVNIDLDKNGTFIQAEESNTSDVEYTRRHQV